MLVGSCYCRVPRSVFRQIWLSPVSSQSPGQSHCSSLTSMSVNSFEIMIPKWMHEKCARRSEILHCRIKILCGRRLQPTLLEIPADTSVRIFFEALSDRCVEFPAQTDVAHVLVSGYKHTRHTQLHVIDFDWWKVGTMKEWMPLAWPTVSVPRRKRKSSCSTAATEEDLCRPCFMVQHLQQQAAPAADRQHLQQQAFADLENS